MTDGVELVEIDGEEKMVIDDVESSAVEDDKDCPSTVKINKSSEQEEEVEGGYGWVNVGAVFFVHVFVLGNIYSFGIFYPVYVDYFDGSAASIAWIGSIGASLMAGVGVYSGKLADYYGNGRMVALGGVLIAIGFFLASFSTAVWQLYITQGFIAGLGYSASFIGGVSVVGPWFTKNRALAVGIAVAGSGLGQFAISLISGALIRAYTWRGALKIQALMELVALLLCGWLIKRKTPLITTWSSNNSSLEYFKDKNFILLFFSGLLVSLGYLVPFTYLPAYSQQYGVSESSSVFLVSLIGITSALGRISTGFFADRLGKLEMLKLCYLGSGVATLCWLVCWNFTTILIMGLVFGFFVGGVISLLPSVAAELYGIERLASILGLLYSCTAFGNLLSAPIAGFMLQGYHSYGPPIIAAGCFQLSSLVLVQFVDLRQKSTASSGGYNEVKSEKESCSTPQTLQTRENAEEYAEEFEL